MNGSSWAPHSFFTAFKLCNIFYSLRMSYSVSWLCLPSFPFALRPSSASQPHSLSPSKITQGVPFALSIFSWVWSHLLELKENRLLLHQEQVEVGLYFRSRRMISNIHLTEELATRSKSLSFVQVSCFPKLDSSFHNSKPCHSVSKSSTALSVPPPCTVIILS